MLVLTCTLVGVFLTALWALLDLITIMTGACTDGKGNKVTQWT